MERPRGEYRAVARPPSSRAAVLGIVSGVTGIALLLVSAGIRFEFGVLFGVLGILGARSAQRQMAAGRPGRPRQARAAMTIGIVAIVLSVVAMVTWLVLGANGITQQDLLDWAERERDRLQAR